MSETGGITKQQSWQLELRYIPEEMRSNEPELQRKRWFDYREYLPGQLTLFFLEQYKIVYRDWYARIRDKEESERIPVVHFSDLFTSRELMNFWRARQAADDIGCTYDFYVRFTFERAIERCWKYLPRPNQLYNDELIADARNAWAETLAVQLKLPQSAIYKADSFKGLPEQVDYYEYLEKMVNDREHKHMILSRLIYREGALNKEIAVKIFGAELVEQATLHFYSK